MIQLIRLFVAALHVAVLLAACGVNAAAPYDAACKVSVANASGLRSFGGSGVLIGVTDDEALVLTVQHVALRPGRIALCTWGAVETVGAVVAVSDQADVALLVVGRPAGIEPVPLALPTKDTGPFVLAGYPGHDRDTLRWQQGDYVSHDDVRLVVTCQPEKGMSGGPCFDKYGRVCGTVSAFNPVKQIGVCGSGPAMLDLVDDYLRIQ